MNNLEESKFASPSVQRAAVVVWIRLESMSYQEIVHNLKQHCLFDEGKLREENDVLQFREVYRLCPLSIKNGDGLTT